MAVRTRSTQPVPSAPVAALAAIPAGPALATALAALDPQQVTEFEAVLVLRAQFRQANHERGRLMRSVVEVLRRNDPGNGIDQDWQTADLVAANEVRAALVLTRPAAKDLCTVARDLAVRLPAVLDAHVSGGLDDARARIFSTWTADLCDRHARTLVDRLLPTAPRLTVAELITAIRKAVIELDPEWARRRYERGLKERRVEGKLRTDGTADLSGYHLPAGVVAIACSRLDRLAHRLKQAGYPGPLDHIRAELFAGKLTGQFTYLDDDEIFEMLMVTSQPGWDRDLPDTDSAEDDADPPPVESDSTVDGPTSGTQDDVSKDEGDAPSEPGDGSPPSDDPRDEPSGPSGGPGSVEPREGEGSPDPVRASGGGKGRGLRLLAGLPTIAGLDRRPGELLGWGFLHAELARHLSATPGASWWYALVEPDGTPLDVGAIRKRPTQSWTDDPNPIRANLEVWLHLTRDELTHLGSHPPPGWELIVADLAQRVANSAGGPPNGDPTDRLPSAALRRWIAVRDRRCVFPGCRVAAQHCDADHTVEHAKGGPTVDVNLANACGPDHALRHDGGWTVEQPAPGRVVWTSPLGHRYERVPPFTQALVPIPEPTRPDEDPTPYWGDDIPYSPSDRCTYDVVVPQQRAPEPAPPEKPPPYADAPPF